MNTNLTELCKRALARMGLMGVKKNDTPPRWEANRTARILAPATCYIIFADDMPVVTGEYAERFNEKQLAKYTPVNAFTPPLFILPEVIKQGVEIARVDILGRGRLEAIIADRVVILLPGGKVIGPPQVTSWRPRTPAEDWAREFNPMQELFERKEPQ